MTAKKEKLIRTTVQLSPHQHKALENLSGPGKSISALVRTAIDEYLEPYYEQSYENQKLDRLIEEAQDKIDKLNERATSIENIFDDLKTKV
jgi:Arc/MetJ-type ribon-helix-helix transcriptional regulator